jgi:hypothetical protein
MTQILYVHMNKIFKIKKKRMGWGQICRGARCDQERTGSVASQLRMGARQDPKGGGE